MLQYCIALYIQYWARIGFCTIYWFYFMLTCGQMNARVGISIYSDKKTGG